MLLFNTFCIQKSNVIIFISKHLMLLFNTWADAHGYCVPEFQNISCYCLTNISAMAQQAQNLFQNISCYCLTEALRNKTYHMDLFQNISCYCLTQRRISLYIILNISKHLMLLFNMERNQTHGEHFSFQNISCYCLTSTCSCSLCSSIDFKTSHVIV